MLRSDQVFPERASEALSAVVVLLAMTAVGAAASSLAQDQSLKPSSISGTWVLDRYLSDHPEQVARALRLAIGDTRIEADTGQPADRGGRGEAGGREGGRHGGFGQVEPAMPRGQSPIGDADRKLLTEVVDAVRFPTPRLVISQTETTVTFAGAGTPRVLRTDGKTEKQLLTAGSIDRRAVWEGPSLVVRYEVGHAGTLVYTYECAPTTGQLVVRVNFERNPGEPGPFAIKFVYDAAPADETVKGAR